MKRQLLNTLIVASFATIACTAGAQNTPSPPAGAQYGSPTGAAPAQDGTGASGISNGGNGMGAVNAQPMRDRALSDQVQGYIDARKACDSQPISQVTTCNNDVNSRFSSIDAKCQKLSGAALVDCVHGADHGN